MYLGICRFGLQVVFFSARPELNDLKWIHTISLIND